MNKKITNSFSSVGFDHNQHCNVASESVTVLPHLTHHRAYTFPLVESLNQTKHRRGKGEFKLRKHGIEVVKEELKSETEVEVIGTRKES